MTRCINNMAVHVDPDIPWQDVAVIWLRVCKQCKEYENEVCNGVKTLKMNGCNNVRTMTINGDVMV